MALQLPKDTEKLAVSSIRRFFAAEMEETVGDLKAGLLLKFFVSEIAPTIYNQAITDAQAYAQNLVTDMSGSCYQDEFGYWKSKR